MIKAAPLRSAAARRQRRLCLDGPPAHAGPAHAARHLIRPAHPARISAIAGLLAASRPATPGRTPVASSAYAHVDLQDRPVKGAPSGRVATDSGANAGQPVDHDLRIRTPAYWSDTFHWSRSTDQMPAYRTSTDTAWYARGSHKRGADRFVKWRIKPGRSGLRNNISWLQKALSCEPDSLGRTPRMILIAPCGGRAGPRWPGGRTAGHPAASWCLAMRRS